MSSAGILLCAGSSERMGFDKLTTPLNGQAPLLRSALALAEGGCDCIIAAVNDSTRAFWEQTAAPLPMKMVAGGQTRFASVKNALAVAEGDIAVIHDAARPLAGGALVRACIRAAAEYGSGVAAVPMADTVLRWEAEWGAPVPRENLYRMQTPQAFSLPMIREAYEGARPGATDDATVFLVRYGILHLVPGSEKNRKLTTAEDWHLAAQTASARPHPMATAYGIGYDTHSLVLGRPLILGGVNIPYHKGLQGHSDADVLLHAIIDALLGACALGDIGGHFPDTDPRYKNADSRVLLRKTATRLPGRPLHVDATIVCERPKLKKKYIPGMRENIAEDLDLPLTSVSVKATTTEGHNDEGRGLCISAQAIVTVQ